MGKKAIQYLMILVGVWSCLCTPVLADRDQQIYSLPQTEAEDVVVRWLESRGFSLRRSGIDNQGVRLYAQKGPRLWQITLWPHSPLATRIKASHTVNGTTESSYLQDLWIVLDDHLQAVMGSPPRHDEPKPDTVFSKTDAVVCIHVGDAGQSLQVTGFVIDKKGLIICTAHGLRDIKKTLTVVLRDGRELPGWVIKMDKRCDLTLVDVKTDLEVSLNLSYGRDLLEEAETIYSVVCSDNAEGAVFPGIVIGPPRKTDGQVLWQANMQIRPGSSGSPVFDHQGNLVAVVKGRYRGADKMGFLIPFGSLMKFLGGASK